MTATVNADAVEVFAVGAGGSVTGTAVSPARAAVCGSVCGSKVGRLRGVGEAEPRHAKIGNKITTTTTG
jgi:hypothetical protein